MSGGTIAAIVYFGVWALLVLAAYMEYRAGRFDAWANAIPAFALWPLLPVVWPLTALWDRVRWAIRRRRGVEK